MTLRLILIRHAKSDWDSPHDNDHARILNARGRRSADAVGGWLVAQGYVPDLIISSDAARTAETTARIMDQLPTPPARQFSHALYHASPMTILDVIKDAPAQTLAIVAHNPGIGIVAHMLAAKKPGHPRFEDYPTCATTVIDCPVAQWSDLENESNMVTDFVIPRDLLAASGQTSD